MTSRLVRVLLVGALVPVVAAAVPTTVSHQGRVLGASGDPISGTESVTFGLHTAASGGSTAWTQTVDVLFEDGYFSTLLSGVDSSELSGDRWFSVTIDGAEVGPRQPVTSVPFAVRAQSVERVGLADVTDTCDAGSTGLHGTLRYRTSKVQVCTPDGWQSLSFGTFSASGGSVTDIAGYRIHTFTSDGTFTATGATGTVEVLVVAGGGGGGGRSGGGGGGGGLLYTNTYNVLGGQAVSVVVGAGGSGGIGSPDGTHGQNGGNSSFGTLVAVGGGGGGSDTQGTGSNGGSGGGGRYGNPGGTGTSGQGFAGGGSFGNPYAGGGGGGAGGPGIAGTSGGEIGDGGPGAYHSITGSSVPYAGGGGGGSHNPANGRGFGGVGGGGNGGAPGGSNPGSNGTANTGGGGGAGSTSSGGGGVGGNGGSGIVIVRYPR
jgi:hypothetical protein